MPGFAVQSCPGSPSHCLPSSHCSCAWVTPSPQDAQAPQVFPLGSKLQHSPEVQSLSRLHAELLQRSLQLKSQQGSSEMTVHLWGISQSAFVLQTFVELLQKPPTQLPLASRQIGLNPLPSLSEGMQRILVF